MALMALSLQGAKLLFRIRNSPRHFREITKDHIAIACGVLAGSTPLEVYHDWLMEYDYIPGDTPLGVFNMWVDSIKWVDSVNHSSHYPIGFTIRMTASKIYDGLSMAYVIRSPELFVKSTLWPAIDGAIRIKEYIPTGFFRDDGLPPTCEDEKEHLLTYALTMEIELIAFAAITE